MPDSDSIRVIRFSSFMWIGYLILLAAINQLLFTDLPEHANSYYYYIFLGCLAILCVGLAYWPKIQKRLGKTFIPIIIGLITVLPIAATATVIKLLGPAPMLDPQSSIILLLPFFLTSFLLVALQYRWLHMLLLILVINLLNLASALMFPPPGPEPVRLALTMSLIQTIALTMSLIQTIIFVVVGFSINYLISRIRNQQQSLEAANISLTHYASTLEQLATSRERNRLSRELHDTLAHTLSGLAVQLETVKAYFDINPKTSQTGLEKALASVHSGLEETRRALKALRASPLDEWGLAKATATMAEDLTSRAHLALNLSIPDKMPVLSPDVEQCIYRIAQEAITNAINHACAKQLEVKLEFLEGKVVLNVIDDGVGFDTGNVGGSNHFGLSVMQERAQINGGKLNIISQQGAGTTIRLII
ncbi:MAG: sensor histidine kinase [Dehalococcoidia bacterium]